jgi:hypothetical protein
VPYGTARLIPMPSDLRQNARGAIASFPFSFRLFSSLSFSAF